MATKPLAPTEKSIIMSGLRALGSADVQFALAIVAIIFMMIIPLSPFMLDMMLAISITSSLMILLVSIYVKEPLEISTFPTILLLTTLFRLSLNVATTRNILLDGATGEVSAVVHAFGNFVIGGNYFVGFVLFVILVIINFIVITKGAGRVAEAVADSRWVPFGPTPALIFIRRVAWFEVPARRLPPLAAARSRAADRGHRGVERSSPHPPPQPACGPLAHSPKGRRHPSTCPCAWTRRFCRGSAPR